MTLRKPTSRRARVMLGLAGLVTVLLIAVAVVAFSGGSTSKTASASTTSATRTAFAQCMKEHGVTMPAHTPGSGPSTQSGSPPAGGAISSAGDTARQEAFKACGARGQHFRPGSGREAGN
jgi:hypothetical protein